MSKLLDSAFRELTALLTKRATERDEQWRTTYDEARRVNEETKKTAIETWQELQASKDEVRSLTVVNGKLSHQLQLANARVSEIQMQAEEEIKSIRGETVSAALEKEKEDLQAAVLFERKRTP